MDHISLRGTRYEAGLQWGRTLAKRGYFLLAELPFPLTRERRDFGSACLPIYQACFPEILEEIEGLALGQSCPAEELQAVLFSMYALPPACHCSCFAISAGGQTLLGRNSDFWTALEDQNLNVRYEFSGGAYSFTGNTTAFLEMEDGVNSRALAAGLTAVAPAAVKPGLNAGMLVRYILEKCENVSQGLKALETLPIASAQTITLADGSGNTAVAECCAGGRRVIRPTGERPFVYAVNRFMTEEMRPLQAAGVDDWRSGERRGTLERALCLRRGPLDIPAAQALLAGKEGFLCQEDRSAGKGTVWSVVYDLTGREIYRAEGDPSRVPFCLDDSFSF